MAPNENGLTVICDWADDAKTLLWRAQEANAALDAQATAMLADLEDLTALGGIARALFDVGMLAGYRDNQTFPPDAPLATFAIDSVKKVIGPSLPGGSFGWMWSVVDRDPEHPTPWKAFDQMQKDKLDSYAALAADFKRAPAAHLNLVNAYCALELESLRLLAQDGDTEQQARTTLASALEWFAREVGGTPPESAGGSGSCSGCSTRAWSSCRCPTGCIRS